MSDPKLTIEELTAQITPENKHDYIPVGSPDPSFERTRLLYRFSIILISVNTIIAIAQILSRA